MVLEPKFLSRVEDSYLEWRIAQAVAGSSEGLEERRERFPRILELLLYIAHAN